MYYHVISFTNTLEAYIYDFWSVHAIYIQKTRTNHVRLFLFSHHGHEINIFSTHYVT